MMVWVIPANTRVWFCTYPAEHNVEIFYVFIVMYAASSEMGLLNQHKEKRYRYVRI